MRNHLPKVLLLLGVTPGIYLRVFANDFVWEDISFIVNNTYIHDLRNVFSFFTSGDCVGLDMVNSYYRPLTTLSFAFDWNLWGLDATGFHAVNLAFHLCSAILLYFLLARFFDSRASLLGALLFAAYPVNVEPVAYICARADLVCGFFLLGSVFSFVLHQDEGKKTLLWLSVLCFALSLFSKIIGHLSPLIVAGFVRLRGNSRGDWKQLVPFALVAALYWFMRLHASGVMDFQDDPLQTRIATAGNLFFHYLGITLFPINLKYMYFMDPWTDATALPVLLAWLALIALFVLISLKVWNKSLPALGFAWYFIGLAPVSGLFAILNPTIMSHRYLYIPLMGGIFGAVALLDKAIAAARFKRRTNLYLGACSVVVLLFALQSAARVGAWENNLSLWRETYKSSPNVAGVANGYASALLTSGNAQEAERILAATKTAGVGDEGTDILLAIAVMERGDYLAARERLAGVLRRQPENTWALSIYAENLYYLGAPCEGELVASKALSLNRHNRRLMDLQESLEEACGQARR